MSSVEIPAGFESTGDRNVDLKMLVTAQTLGFNSHKVQIASLMETLAPITTVNGTDVYARRIQLDGLTCNYESEQSELLKLLIGADNTVLQEICDVSGDADDVWFKWQQRFGFTSSDFKIAIESLSEQISDVASVEIESTMVSYWDSALTNNPSYIIADASGTLAGRDAYDDELTGFTYQDTVAEVLYTKASDTSGDWDLGISNEEFIPHTYTSRVPASFRYHGSTSLSNDDWGLEIPSVPFDIRWTSEVTEYRESDTSMSSTYLPTVVFKNSTGTDITSNYDQTIIQAITSMILISGDDFMTQTSSVSKTGEELIDENLDSYYVTGKEIWSGTINSAFINDVSGTYWKAYTQMVGSDPEVREFPKQSVDEVLIYEYKYGQHFWYFRDNYVNDSTIETLSDGLFIYSNDRLYLAVDKFRNCTEEEYGKWIFALAYIQPLKDSGCCGIGGFLGDLLGGLMSIVGSIFGLVVNVFKSIVILFLKVIGTYNFMKKHFKEQLDFITHRAATSALSAELFLATGNINTEKLVLFAISQTSVAINMELPEYISSELEITEDEVLLRFNSSSNSKQDFIDELKYNPFARMELEENTKYMAFNHEKRKDPFTQILN